MSSFFDVAIIGGGINGCGCAADAALRGLSVFLCEKDDIASKTSSSSTKLIHGGLRYLENYDFGLVKKALDERQKLLNLAPHIVYPQPFIIPYQSHMRPAWMLRLGLYIYDHLSRNNALNKSKSIQRDQQNQYFSPLQDKYTKGFLFSDAAANDARLTLANAKQAREYGAQIKTQTTLLKASVQKGIWTLCLKSPEGKIFEIQAKSLINAAGPWVNQVSESLDVLPKEDITWVKGSHIVVPALYEGDHAYLLQHQDKRIVFVIPYHGYSMIGTTEVDFKNSLDAVKIDEEEITYLCDLVRDFFHTTLDSSCIIYSWSGVRALLADSKKSLKKLSRDYKFHYSDKPAPSITIYGGKITTYRKLAEQVIDALKPVFPDLQDSKTDKIPLPGAQTLEKVSYINYCAFAKERYQWLDSKLLDRYLKTYGTHTELLLKDCQYKEDLGVLIGNNLYTKEVDYLINYEWAYTTEDILWRRTKLGLEFSAKEVERLQEYLLQLKKIYP